MDRKTIKFLKNSVRENRKKMKECWEANHKDCDICRATHSCAYYNIVKDLEPLIRLEESKIGIKVKQVRNNGWKRND